MHGQREYIAERQTGMKFLKSTLQFDKRKAIIGAALMALTLMICAVCNLWSLSLFGVGFFMVGCIRLNITRRWKYTLYFVWVAATAAVTLVAPLTMLEQPQQMSETVMSLILNFVCIFIVCGVIFIFTAKPRWSVAVGTFLLICLAVVNSFIYQFRGKELGYGDIFSLKTALNVVGQYKARFTAGIIYGFIRWLFVVFIGFSVPGITILSKLRARIISLVSVTALMLVLVFGASNIPIKTWGDEGSRFNGYYLNFYLSIRDSIVKKPKNYNTKNVDNIAQKYVLPDGADKIESKPNVIVIMNESFADFRSLGTLSTNKPVTPFLDSLTEDIVRGYAMSSVYGGNTANSEFEFLTGHSMMFLPENSVPYQQYINNKTNSMAWIMNSYGYKTMATHPYYANGWSRNIVYPYLGFKEITFIEEYTVNHPVRGYVSDRDMAEYILKKLDSKDKDTPLFLFGITMQNHGGYDYSGDDFEQKINLEGYDSEYPKAEQYLSLIHETDSAMEYLLTNLKNYSEDTTICRE